MTPKCQICKTNPVEMAWQPFGPDEDGRRALTMLGSHYRGFPVVKVCDSCADGVRDGAVEFEYKGKRYIQDGAELMELPEYVADGLAYREAQS